MGPRQTISPTLVLTDSEQDARRAVRAVTDPSQHETTFVACESELLSGGRAQVFHQCGYGFPNTPTIGPEATLPSMLGWITKRVAVYARAEPPQPHADPDTLFRSNVRVATPKPSEQFDSALSTQLTRTEKQALDLLASWPFSTLQHLIQPSLGADLLEDTVHLRLQQPAHVAARSGGHCQTHPGTLRRARSRLICPAPARQGGACGLVDILVQCG